MMFDYYSLDSLLSFEKKNKQIKIVLLLLNVFFILLLVLLFLLTNRNNDNLMRFIIALLAILLAFFDIFVFDYIYLANKKNIIFLKNINKYNPTNYNIYSINKEFKKVTRNGLKFYVIECRCSSGNKEFYLYNKYLNVLNENLNCLIVKNHYIVGIKEKNQNEEG